MFWSLCLAWIWNINDMVFIFINIKYERIGEEIENSPAALPNLADSDRLYNIHG